MSYLILPFEDSIIKNRWGNFPPKNNDMDRELLLVCLIPETLIEIIAAELRRSRGCSWCYRETFFNSFDIHYRNQPRATTQAKVVKKYVVISMVLDLKVFVQFDQVSYEKKKTGYFAFYKSLF